MTVDALTQRYYICTETGSESVLITDDKWNFGLIAAALLELALAECICFDDEKVRTCAPLPVDCAPLTPLYDYIQQKGPVSVEKIARVAAAKHLLLLPLMDDSLIWQLQQRVGATLAIQGLVQERTGKKKRFLPTQEAVQAEFAALRAALVDGTSLLDRSTAALALLLDKAGVLAEHFSETECQQMRDVLTQFAQREENAAALSAMQHFEWLWRLSVGSNFLPLLL